MNLSPFAIFKIYHSVFLHFSTEYDYQKYMGKTAYTEEAFNSRQDKYSWVKLSREFATKDADFFEYYFSWLFYTKDKWVTTKSIFEDQARFQLEWLNYSKKHLDNFGMDMIKITGYDAKVIFQKLQYGDIHYQTILILNKFTNIIDHMNKELAGMPVWDLKYKKLKKFQPFYEAQQPMNEMMYRKLITEKQCPAY
jgi:hypothetical protein